MAILPDRSELTTPADDDLYMTTDVSDTTDAATGTDKKITWANIKAGLLTYFDTVYQPLSAVLTATTASFTTAMETKLGFISVTQAVDLDQMEADIAALANGMVYKGNWDASAGTFPGAGIAQTGWFYTVSVAGTVDSIEFAVGDRLIAIVDNASTTVYAANWTKLDATDAVTSVDGQIGNIDLATILFAKTAKTTPVDADTVSFTDSAASNVLKKVTWANVLATIKTYYDSVTSTLTNKTLISTTNTFAEVTTIASSATPTPTGGSRQNELYVTALAADATIAAPTGSPTNGNKLIVRILDNGTSRTLGYNAIYRAVGVTVPTATTISKTIFLGAVYNSAASKWDVIAVAEEA